MHRERVLSIALLLLMVVQLCAAGATALSLQDFNEDMKPTQYSDPPIEITGKSDFLANGFTGLGTNYSPFVLVQRNINAEGMGISIKNTDEYFIIMDCKIGSIDNNGVYLENVTNGRFENCEITGALNAVRVTEGTDIAFVNDTLTDSGTAMFFHTSTRILIEKCRIFGNGRGIASMALSSSVFRENKIFANHEYGIFLDDTTTNCIFYLNEIGWNRNIQDEQQRNAYDYGTNNLWHNSTILLGNKWADYNQLGSYHIMGNASSIDRYASLLTDTVKPKIDAPGNRVISETFVTTHLIWRAVDEYPFYFWIYREGKVGNRGYWTEEVITKSSVEINIGSFNYTLVVVDCAGNYAKATSFIIIAVNAFQGISPTEAILAAVLSVVFVGLVLVCMKR